MTDTTERDAELRRMLVASAELGTFPSRGSRRRSLIAAAAGLVVAGGLVGGGITAAASAGGDSPEDTAHGLAIIDSITRAHTELLGDLEHRIVADTVVIEMGRAPAGATGIAISAVCQVLGKVDQLLDGERFGSVSCDESQGGGGGWVTPISDARAHTLTFDVISGRFEVWAMWVKEPPFPEPSAAQVAALADGIVTREEYVAGFDRFAGCMGALGYPFGYVGREAVVIQYSVISQAVDDGTDELCYVSEFQELDIAWQVSQEDND